MKKQRPTTSPKEVKAARIRNGMRGEESFIKRQHDLEVKDLAQIIAPTGRKKWAPKKQQKKPEVANTVGGATDIPTTVHLMRTGAGQQLQANDTNAETVDYMGLRPKSTKVTGDPVVDCIFTGIPTPYADSRFRDPFTLQRTATFHIVNTNRYSGVSFTPNIGGAMYGGAVTFFGTPKNTAVTWSISSSTVSPGTIMYETAPAITSAKSSSSSNSTSANVQSGGLCSADWYTRPNGAVLTLKPIMTGPEHSIVVNAFPIGPQTWNSILPGSVTKGGGIPPTGDLLPTGWPATVNANLTSVQMSWGGRSWVLKSGDSLNFVALPLDSTALDFCLSNQDRYGPEEWGAQTAWCGWHIWWCAGASAIVPMDSMENTINYTEEAYPRGTTSTQYMTPLKPKESSSVSFDSATNKVQKLVSAGASAIKIISTVASVVSMLGSIAKFVFGSSGGGHLSGVEDYQITIGKPLRPDAYGPVNFLTHMRPTMFMPVTHEHIPMVELHDDEKQDDFTRIERPTTRRPTMPEVLSVDDVRTPRVSKK